MNVLILDRSELARVVKAILNSQEHRSFQSRSLDGAERILRRESVDAIVLNVGSMGRCSAQWVRTWLWGRRPSPRIVVIAAEELEKDERALLEVYHATLLEPPITPRLLLNALGEARHGAGPKRRPISRRFPGTIKPAQPPTDD